LTNSNSKLSLSNIIENDMKDTLDSQNQDQAMKNKFKKLIQELITEPKDISFSNFPYYLDETLKQLLINYTYIFFNEA